MSETPFREPGRLTPAKGVHVSLGGSNWIFLTVCTEKRERWLGQTSVQRALHDIWQNTATARLVSDYLLMPDHLHLFCAPRDLKFTIERWMGFWKDRLAKSLPDAAAAMGVAVLTEEEYFALQTLGEFDTKSSSWLQTPTEIRELGGAIYGDRRYGRVFIGHNGAESYYNGRGFRGSLKV